MQVNLLTICEQKELIRRGDCTVLDLVLAYKKVAEDRKDLNAYLEFFEDSCAEAERLITLQKKFKGVRLPFLYGIPGAIKDNIAIAGRKMTCASKILESYVSPYNATVIDKLNASFFVNLGRVNQDEFGMGASGTHSAFGSVLNPLNVDCLSGGSSSGSAVAVAAGIASFSLGTDTGGSCRLPASYCGIYGFKPTYGGISRYGVAPYAPSLDTVGILARSVRDIDLIFQVISGKCSEDPTTIDCDGVVQSADFCDDFFPFRGLKVAIFPKLIKRMGSSVQKAYALVQDCLTKEGVEFCEFSLGCEDELVTLYCITAFSEAASSLSRYDGVRYGNSENPNFICGDRYFIPELRAIRLGHEVCRRILLGNFFLSEKNYQKYYYRAVQLRNLLMDRASDLQNRGFSVYLFPGFGEAPKNNLTEKEDYSSDLSGVLSNLLGSPALVIPIYLDPGKLPVSFQLSGIRGSDRQILRMGHHISQLLNNYLKR